MNREYAVIYNRSLEKIFGNQARSVAEELNCPLFYTDQLQFRKDSEIEFRKCVYFDKDIITGLRLEMLGIRLFNSIGAIETCDDKRRTCEMLRPDGKIPKTVYAPLLFSEDEEFQTSFLAQAESILGFPMIGKLAYGSLGKQVRFISNKEELLQCSRDWRGQPYLFQEFIESSRGKDLRIYVVNGNVIAAMERFNPHDFRSNIGTGAHGSPIVPSKEFEAAAIEACSLLGLDFGGVDILYGKYGEPILCEVNSNALFQELNAVCNVHIESHIAEMVRSKEHTLDLSAFEL